MKEEKLNKWLKVNYRGGNITCEEIKKLLQRYATEATKELQEENERLKSIEDVATLIKANNSTVVTLMELNNRLVSANKQIEKMKCCRNCENDWTIDGVKSNICVKCKNHSNWELAE